jgi:hypothetical protein
MCPQRSQDNGEPEGAGDVGHAARHRLGLSLRELHRISRMSREEEQAFAAHAGRELAGGLVAHRTSNRREPCPHLRAGLHPA